MSECMSAFGGMQPTELSAGLAQIKSEHPSLLTKMAGLQLLSEQIENQVNFGQNFADLKRHVASFMAELDPHSKREEDVLFPMMGQYIGTASGPIAVMEYEHEEAKSLIAAFLNIAEKDEISEDEIKNAARLVDSACEILSQHFSKEENVLFPMAERMLSSEEKEELYRRITEIK